MATRLPTKDETSEMTYRIYIVFFLKFIIYSKNIHEKEKNYHIIFIKKNYEI